MTAMPWTNMTASIVLVVSIAAVAITFLIVTWGKDD